MFPKASCSLPFKSVRLSAFRNHVARIRKVVICAPEIWLQNELFGCVCVASWGSSVPSSFETTKELCISTGFIPPSFSICRHLDRDRMSGISSLLCIHGSGYWPFCPSHDRSSILWADQSSTKESLARLPICSHRSTFWSLNPPKLLLTSTPPLPPNFDPRPEI